MERRYHHGDDRRTRHRVAPGARPPGDSRPLVTRRHARGRRRDLGGGAGLSLRPRPRPCHGHAERLRCAPGRVLRRDARSGAGAAGAGDAAGGARRVFEPGRPAHRQRLPPALVRLLHPAAPARVRGRRGPRPDRPAGHRHLARRPDRRVRRGGGAALAVRLGGLWRGQLRDPHLGRRDGQLHRDGPRPGRAPGTPAWRHRAAAGARARGRPRVRLRPDPLLDRSGAR